jgi:hypothetical protein
MLVLQRPVDLVHHILEVLRFQIAENLHSCPLNLFHIADCRCAAVVNGDYTMHEVIPALFILRMHLLNHLRNLENAVIYNLDAVMQVGELVLLRADVCCGHVFQHLGDVVSICTLLFLLSLVLLVCLLFVALLRGEILLLLVLLGVCVAVLVGLFARVRVCG